MTDSYRYSIVLSYREIYINNLLNQKISYCFYPEKIELVQFDKNGRHWDSTFVISLIHKDFIEEGRDILFEDKNTLIRETADRWIKEEEEKNNKKEKRYSLCACCDIDEDS